MLCPVRPTQFPVSFLVLVLGVVTLSVGGCGDGESAMEPGGRRLVFVSQPSDATAGVALSPAVRVAIQDRAGNTLSDATDAVTVELAVNPGSASLEGTVTVEAAAGIATFPDLVIERAAAGYVLRASSSGLEGASSVEFAITPAAATGLAFAVDPTDAEGTEAISPGVEVAFQDDFGNTVTDRPEGAHPGHRRAQLRQRQLERRT